MTSTTSSTVRSISELKQKTQEFCDTHPGTSAVLAGFGFGLITYPLAYLGLLKYLQVSSHKTTFVIKLNSLSDARQFVKMLDKAKTIDFTVQ